MLVFRILIVLELEIISGETIYIHTNFRTFADMRVVRGKYMSSNRITRVC